MTHIRCWCMGIHLRQLTNHTWALMPGPSSPPHHSFLIFVTLLNFTSGRFLPPIPPLLVRTDGWRKKGAASSSTQLVREIFLLLLQCGSFPIFLRMLLILCGPHDTRPWILHRGSGRGRGGKRNYFRKGKKDGKIIVALRIFLSSTMFRKGQLSILVFPERARGNIKINRREFILVSEEEYD